ncbi:hypothetical protein H9635_06220 [Solibacillus sp. A46]|uniref:Uncharacterized protein n=1 Tax=Solibacillus faecavium TaxID=2762221 RepID=A0ABR8XWK6_9BACL|nr:hypothetical protein [Solibacillus faecavium]MBD8036334.1 hypothetical protein [Solibacillus faecavium]
MKKWIFLIAFFVFAGVIFSIWSEQNKVNYIGGILNNISSVDLIIVKDSETEKQIYEYTQNNDFFNDMVNIYDQPFFELKKSEKKLLNKESTYVIEYLNDNTIQYKVNIYKVEDSTEVFVEKEYTTEINEFDYIFSPESTNHSYVFVTEKYHNLLGLNDGLKQIINDILNL